MAPTLCDKQQINYSEIHINTAKYISAWLLPKPRKHSDRHTHIETPSTTQAKRL